jgi:hypothetical protein
MAYLPRQLSRVAVNSHGSRHCAVNIMLLTTALTYVHIQYHCLYALSLQWGNALLMLVAARCYPCTCVGALFTQQHELCSTLVSQYLGQLNDSSHFHLCCPISWR